MKTLFILSITAIALAVGMSAHAYFEIERIKENQVASFEHTKESLEHWEEFAEWEIKHGDGVTPEQYFAKWKQYSLDALVLDDRYIKDMEERLYP